MFASFIDGVDSLLRGICYYKQAFRPPTPPHPSSSLPVSHYRKKRSEDVLPGEGLQTFMKPPVHVVS